MASSKTPHVYIPVPNRILELINERPLICFANYRPEQRSLTPDDAEAAFRQQLQHTDGNDIEYDVARFLKALERDGHRIAIHYQGYDDNEQRTAVVDMRAMTCWSNGTPRLDFDKPENWSHCSNFWGAFILGIAAVAGINPTLAIEDPDATKFAEIVLTHGVGITLPAWIEARDCV